MSRERIGFIGGGQMATALITGALKSGILSAERVIVIENSPPQCERLKQLFPELEIQTELAAAANCVKVILAVKPQTLRQIGTNIAQGLPGNRLWVSIAAGVSLNELSEILGSDRLVRVMPNTPAQVGAGAAGVSASAGATKDDIQWVLQLMQSVGSCFQVADAQMHAVTGVAGSGPAYIYLIIEALSDAGVAGGLPRDTSTQLAAQMVMGAAKMVLETGRHPGELKDQVTSPAGTTIEAIRVLEAAGVRSAMMEAVAACIERSRELETQ